MKDAVEHILFFQQECAADKPPRTLYLRCDTCGRGGWTSPQSLAMSEGMAQQFTLPRAIVCERCADRRAAARAVERGEVRMPVKCNVYGTENAPLAGWSAAGAALAADFDQVQKKKGGAN